MSPRERFVIVPRDVLYAPVSDRAVRVYAVIAEHADEGGTAWPSQARISDLTGCSRSSVNRALGELVAAGLVIRRRQPRPRPTRYSVVARHRFKPFDSATGDAIGEADCVTGDSLIVSPVTHELEPRTRDARAHAHARESADRDALDALMLGEHPQLDRWLVVEGVHYVDVPATFEAELRERHAITSPDVVAALLDRATRLVSA